MGIKRAAKKYRWLIVLLLFLFIALPVRYCIERVKPFEQMDRSPQWTIDLKLLRRQKIKNGVLFHYKRNIEAMFYTELVVYPFLPDEATIRDLQAKGYEVFLNDAGSLPASLKTMEGVKMLHLSEVP